MTGFILSLMIVTDAKTENTGSTTKKLTGHGEPIFSACRTFAEEMRAVWRHTACLTTGSHMFAGIRRSKR